MTVHDHARFMRGPALEAAREVDAGGVQVAGPRQALVHVPAPAARSGLTAAIPMENPYCSFELTCSHRSWLTAALIPVENPYCSCELARRSVVDGTEEMIPQANMSSLWSHLAYSCTAYG